MEGRSAVNDGNQTEGGILYEFCAYNGGIQKYWASFAAGRKILEKPGSCKLNKSLKTELCDVLN